MGADPQPRHLVVMGVAGSGKSTVAAALGVALGAEVIDADDYHSSANVAKMTAGIPLTDTERLPWLEALAARIGDAHAEDRSTVLACSALRRSYRDVLRSRVPAGSMMFLELGAAPDVLRARMEGREHFMPPSLLTTQIDALEPLQPDERGVRLDSGRSVDEVVADALAVLRERTG